MSGYQQDEDSLAYGEDRGQRGPSGQGGGDRNIIGDTFKKLKSKYDQYQTTQGSQNPYGQPLPGQQGPYGQPSYGSGSVNQQRPQQQSGSTSYGSTSTTQQYGQPPYNSAPGSQQQSQQQYGTSTYGSSSTRQQYGQTAYNPTSSGQQQQQYGQSQYNTQAPGQPGYPGRPESQQKPDIGTKIFGALESTVQSIGTDVAGLLGTTYPGQQQPQQQQYGYPYSAAPQGAARNRFDSFASDKPGNDVKWYVDGCGYFWAVSLALERARQSIWILDWWLSPELYLRRPPAQNEGWRLDRVLQRAANRGVKINVIVYKEVTQALTLSSSHTKHALEALSPNIAVFRHPDHLPDAQTAQSSLVSGLQGLKLDAAGASKLGADALKGLYGLSDDVILYWAHHEKLLLVDNTIAFMGGLDLCFGRWDTNQHSIADVHGADINEVVFPGQDYNNARIMDFNDVAQPFQNKLDRTKSSRMGWSDISVSIEGPSVQDLDRHFRERWNFIYDEKYNVRQDQRYRRLPDTGTQFSFPQHAQQAASFQQSHTQPQYQSQNYLQTAQPGVTNQYPPPPGSEPYTTPAWQSTSRPHTPSAPLGTPSYHTASPQQGQSQTQQYSNTEPQVQSYSQTQPETQQYNTHTQAYPPPPPGPPPQPLPTQAYSDVGYQTAAYVPPQSHSPAPPDIHQPPAYTGYQAPSPGYQASSTAPPEQAQATQYPAYHPSYPPTSDTNQSGDYAQYQPSTSQPHELHGQPSYSQSPLGTSRGLNEYEQTPGYNDYQGDDRGIGEERGMRGRMDQYKQDGHRLGSELQNIGNFVAGQAGQKVKHAQGKYLGGNDQYGRPHDQRRFRASCQILRSCTKWSNGTATEHSVQNAYIDLINNSQHFIYIENQFFITATSDEQRPVQNKIGRAIADRVIRAARNNERFKIIVCIPAVPGFAGDLIEESSLGTRAIMEFQYNSINRGGHSIMEVVAREGVNPLDYIRFYNLRNYNRINTTAAMRQAEQQSGVSYEDARKQHDDSLGAGYGGYGEGTNIRYGQTGNQYQQYQAAAQQAALPGAGRWDTVAECYMLGGQDIRNVPWDGPTEAELDAFVSEELYIHTKIMIVDDRYAIIGSANLNDRSMLGTHDSEIAILINDATPVQSYMAGQQWQAGLFAATLRRQMFRKHLGLLRPQDMRRPDANFDLVGIPNSYDWNSPEDSVVSDPLSDTFQSLWNSRARTNTDVFRKAFRVIPDDNVRTWTEYKEFYELFFRRAGSEADGRLGPRAPARVEWGHVVRDDFPGGVRELKELLSRVKGTLVEMPLCFLDQEDLAKEGLTLNALTEEIYT